MTDQNGRPPGDEEPEEGTSDNTSGGGDSTPTNGSGSGNGKDPDKKPGGDPEDPRAADAGPFGIFGGLGGLGSQGPAGPQRPTPPGFGRSGGPSGGSSGPGGRGGSGGGRPGGQPTSGSRIPGGKLGITLAVVVGLVLLLSWLATVWTDYLWYTELGYQGVFTTRIIAQVLLFAGAALVVGAATWVSLFLAHKTRPIYAPTTPEQQNLDRYRAALEPVRRLVFIAAPAVLGVFAGAAAAQQWQTALMWWNRQSFADIDPAMVDPHFEMDVGFFIFSLPWFNALVSFATLALGLSLLGALVGHYIYGGLMLQSKGEKTTKAARVHLSILLAALIAVRAVAFWLERYNLSTNDHGRITGMNYTDVNAVLPTRGILAIAALLCAVLFIATIWTKGWRLPITGLGGLVVVALLLGTAYPAIIQNFRVQPTEAALEAEYIQRNIDSTLQAYGLEDVQIEPYAAEVEPDPQALQEEADNIPGIRILDPAIVSPTFNQLQSVRNYYQFPDALDVDRYQSTEGGDLVDTVIAVRELNLEGLDAGQRNWVNDHTRYTHGFGVVAAYGNQRQDDGPPRFFHSSIPPRDVSPEVDEDGMEKYPPVEMPEYEPRIYFGEVSPNYSIVGAPEDADPAEFDYPTGTGGEVSYTYSGEGGVGIGSFQRRVAYAIKYRQIEIVLSDNVNSESRILDHREPRERVERVAPWLRLDGNPYPAVVDGRVLWIVDGYTVSDQFPYSRLQQLGEVTEDTLVATTQNVRSIGSGDVNYIRNSVKATVDAYTGEVTLYAWEEDDPILQAWRQVYPDTVIDADNISGELMGHLRYPEDLFKVQREILGQYHVQNAGEFYTGQDFWETPVDPTRPNANVSTPLPPYYLSIAMPDQDEPTFSLTSSYIPRGGDRQNLAGYIAVDADAGREDGVVRDGYGQIRVLEMPSETTVWGPGQFQAQINSSNVTSPNFGVALSQYLNLNSQQGSIVQYGNVLTVPFGGGLLYVEPIYVRSDAASSYPLQRLVVVSFGDQLAWAATLDQANNLLFTGAIEEADPDAPLPDPDAPVEPDPTTPDPTDPDPTEPTEPEPTEPPAPPADDDLAQALQDAQEAYADGEEALANGDWVAYGEAQERLRDAINRAIQLSPEGGVIDLNPDNGTDEDTGGEG